MYEYLCLWSHPYISTMWFLISVLNPIPVYSICGSEYYPLSHTWVWYPWFSGHGVKCPILTTVVPGISGDLIGCTICSKWGPFGDLYLARKNLLCVRNKLFLGDIKFSQRRTHPVKCFWWQIVPMQESTNEWKNLTFFLSNGTCENTMVKPQTVRYRSIK